MKKINPYTLIPRLLMMLVMILASVQYGEAQGKVLAQYELKSNQVVSCETNVNTDDDTYAEVKTYGGAALGLGSYSGPIQMKFDANIPGDQWSYMRVDLDG